MALHPQAQGLMDMMAESGAPPLYEQTVDQARELSGMIGQLVGEGPAMHEVRELTVPVTGGSIRARLYRPAESAPGLVVYYHGGGWVVGEIDHFDTVCKLLAAESGCDVVSVGYRLAPEHPYPTAVEDAYESFVWASETLAAGRPVVVAGDSAGGNLAAVTALRARDRKGPAIAAQVLVYPVTNADFDCASYQQYAEGYILDRLSMIWFYDLYTPNADDRKSSDCSPLLAESLAGLPPAIVFHAEYDPLRDEGVEYARRLSEAGVEVETKMYDDSMHGFFTMPNFLERGNQAIAEAGAFVRAKVGG